MAHSPTQPCKAGGLATPLPAPTSSSSATLCQQEHSWFVLLFLLLDLFFQASCHCEILKPECHAPHVGTVLPLTRKTPLVVTLGTLSSLHCCLLTFLSNIVTEKSSRFIIIIWDAAVGCFLREQKLVK